MASRLVVFLLLLISSALTACSPGYVMRAAYEQIKIMANREKIDDVLADEKTPPEIKNKLLLVKEAREYASQIGLNPKNTFKKYAELDRDVLTWVLVASKQDAFQLYTWWFPVVGTVPYKGFFSKDDAQNYAQKLTAKDYEVSVRGSSAFSTLGWFDDPILSSTLKSDEITLVNTVIHESVHTTIWVKSRVEFNESLANFIGTISACDFFKQRLAACKKDDQICSEGNKLFITNCEKEKSLQLEFSGIIMTLFKDLDSLYRTNKDKNTKLSERTLIFNNYISPLKAKFPGMKALQKINNAEIMQYVLYFTGFDSFKKIYEKHDNDIIKFTDFILKNAAAIKRAKDPYTEILSYE